MSGISEKKMSEENQKKSFAGVISSLSTVHKLLISVIAALVIGSILFFSITSKKRDMAVLYSSLSPEDANKIVAALSAEGVPIEGSIDGTTVKVPKSMVYSLRMKLAAKGIPSGNGIGFEIFDKTDFGVTDFVQKVNYNRAISGELARTISGLREVDSAKVHIALPDKSLFVDEEQKPTASVVLRLKSGRKLKREQVDGIVRLVSSAVENLSSSGITIIDSHGNVLSKNFDENVPAELTASQLEIQRETETKLRKSVETMLARVLGQARSVVRINATLDFKQVEKTEEIYDPKSVVRSEKRSTSDSKGAEAPRGVPGVESNLGEKKPEKTTPGKPSSSTQESETINYEIGKTVQHTKLSYGDIVNISVAVILDGTYRYDKDGKKVYVERTPEELASLLRLIKRAVGFQDERGDKISVENIAFADDSEYAVPETAEEKKERLKKERWDKYMKILKYVSYPLAVILVFFFLLRPLFRLVGEAHKPLPEGGDDVSFILEDTERAAAPKIIRKGRSVDDAENEAEAILDAELGVTPERMKSKVLKKKIVEIINRDPKASAMLIRGWLTDK